MKKINIIKENEEFTRIIKNNKSIKYKYFYIYLEKNKNQKNYQFGLSVGKKVGNAVTRNKIRRQLKTIIDEKDYQNDIKCIIIVGRDILNHEYLQIEKDLHDIFKKINIYK